MFKLLVAILKSDNNGGGRSIFLVLRIVEVNKHIAKSL